MTNWIKATGTVLGVFATCVGILAIAGAIMVLCVMLVPTWAFIAGAIAVMLAVMVWMVKLDYDDKDRRRANQQNTSETNRLF